MPGLRALSYPPVRLTTVLSDNNGIVMVDVFLSQYKLLLAILFRWFEYVGIIADPSVNEHWPSTPQPLQMLWARLIEDNFCCRAQRVYQARAPSGTGAEKRARAELCRDLRCVSLKPPHCYEDFALNGTVSTWYPSTQ